MMIHIVDNSHEPTSGAFLPVFPISCQVLGEIISFRG